MAKKRATTKRPRAKKAVPVVQSNDAPASQLHHSSGSSTLRDTVVEAAPEGNSADGSGVSDASPLEPAQNANERHSNQFEVNEEQLGVVQANGDQPDPITQDVTQQTTQSVSTGGHRGAGMQKPRSGNGTSNESELSGSDYGKDREVLLAKRRKRGNRGQSVTDTDEEDNQLDQQVIDESISESPRNREMHQRSQSPDSGGDDDDEDEDEDWIKATGPLPQEGCIEAQKLGVLVTEMAEKIARKYKKSLRDVMIAAGLAVRAARARNPYNMFKKWYAHLHPRQDMTWKDFGKHMTQVYRDTIMSIKDPEKRAEALQPIWDYVDSLDAVESNGERGRRSIVATLQSAKDQFTTLAAAFHSLEEIEIIGAIVYTGMDAGARQCSALFGGSAIVREVFANNVKDARKLLDTITTHIKSAQLKQQGASVLSTAIGSPDVNMRPGESRKDRNRRILTAWMQQNLDRFDNAVVRKMSWKKWLKTAYLNQMRIVSWPAHVEPPGPDFDFKKIGAERLADIVRGYIEYKQNEGSFANVVRIEPWTDEEKQYVNNGQKGAIPLVVSPDGKPLKYLRDCPEWLKQLNKSRKGRSRALPSEAGDSGADGTAVRSSSAHHTKGKESSSRHKSRKSGKAAASAEIPGDTCDDAIAVSSDGDQDHHRAHVKTRTDSRQRHQSKNKQRQEESYSRNEDNRVKHHEVAKNKRLREQSESEHDARVKHRQTAKKKRLQTDSESEYDNRVEHWRSSKKRHHEDSESEDDDSGAEHRQIAHSHIDKKIKANNTKSVVSHSGRVKLPITSSSLQHHAPLKHKHYDMVQEGNTPVKSSSHKRYANAKTMLGHSQLGAGPSRQAKSHGGIGLHGKFKQSHPVLLSTDDDEASNGVSSDEESDSSGSDDDSD